LLTNPSSVKSSQSIPLSDQTDSKIDLISWRERVRSNPNEFLELCLETGLCPDLWSLYEWWDWLTPISVGHKRFDTMFYICCLEKEPKVVLDNSEVTTLKVLKVSHIICISVLTILNYFNKSGAHLLIC
jgi:nucleoside diphosphate-linked moiety X motif 19, mitochondrial